MLILFSSFNGGFFPQHCLSCIHFLPPKLKNLFFFFFFKVGNANLINPLCGDAGIVFSELLLGTAILNKFKNSNFYQATKKKKQLPSESIN